MVALQKTHANAERAGLDFLLLREPRERLAFHFEGRKAERGAFLDLGQFHRIFANSGEAVGGGHAPKLSARRNCAMRTGAAPYVRQPRSTVMTNHLTRRAFLGAGSAAAATPFLAWSVAGERAPFALLAALGTPQDAMDRDLLEVTVPRLQAFYESRKYTVSQVTRWYLDRIARYDPVYRAVLHVDAAGALATAARAGRGCESGRQPISSAARCGVCRSSSRQTPASKAW